MKWRFDWKIINMKQNHYIVTFNNGKTVFASGFNTEDAEILAKSAMIKNGLTYKIEEYRAHSPSIMQSI